FRQSGAPYSEEELAIALVYTEYVRALWQSLSNHLARGDEPVSITAFDKEWYRDFYGEPRAVQEASPAPAARPVMKRAPADTELFRILQRQAADAAGAVALIEARQPEPDLTMNRRTLFAHAQALR